MRWFYYLIFLIIAGVPFSARADIFLEGFRVECIPELGHFEIRAFIISDKHSVEYFKKHSKEMAQKYGIVSLWDKKALPYRSTCSYQGDTYVVEIDGSPVVGHAKVYHATRTAIINVWVNDTQLIKNLVMEDEEEEYRVLSDILFDMESGYFSVSGILYGSEESGVQKSPYYEVMFYRWPFNGMADEFDKIHPFEFPTQSQREKKESQERINKK